MKNILGAYNLTNHQRVLFRELIFRDVKIQRRGTLPHTAGNVVVGAVAGAEPSSIVTSLTDRYAS
jgi:hypothetical protein